MLGKPLEAALLVTDTFDALGIRYLVGGSFASSLHGRSRATMDIDLVAELGLGDVERFVQLLSGEFYCDAEAVRDAIRGRNCFNLLHLGTTLKVDVFVAEDNAYARSQMRRRTGHALLNNPNQAVYVASAEDTILAKLRWYRLDGEIADRQWTDVQEVIKAQGDRLEDEYLWRWAAELQISDLLDRAMTETRGT